jgi:hypothetical protein
MHFFENLELTKAKILSKKNKKANQDNILKLKIQ